MFRLLGRGGETGNKEPAVYGKSRLLNWKPGGWDWGLASLSQQPHSCLLQSWANTLVLLAPRSSRTEDLETVVQPPRRMPICPRCLTELRTVGHFV